jgi:hypothetical protein
VDILFEAFGGGGRAEIARGVDEDGDAEGADSSIDALDNRGTVLEGGLAGVGRESKIGGRDAIKDKVVASGHGGSNIAAEGDGIVCIDVHCVSKDQTVFVASAILEIVVMAENGIMLITWLEVANRNIVVVTR